MKGNTKIAVFASGSGSNFEAIARACKEGRLPAKVALCVCDQPGAYVTERAKKYGIPVLEIHPKSYTSKSDFEEVILAALQREGVEFICLAGYMRLIGDVLLKAYESKIVNIHPSLLPAFPGKDAIGKALAYGVKVFGVTIHFVDASLDGGKIISQVAFPYCGEDREELETMVHAHEHSLYVTTLKYLFKSTNK